jgi:WD40 repeat protein
MTTPRQMLSLVTLAALPLLACTPETVHQVVGLQADRFSDAEWSEPVSLGPTINASGFNDQQAAPSKDGLSLYFASARPEASGDVVFDLNIWVSQRACADDACPWGTPVSLGSTVNSSVNDFAPTLSRDGHWLFFASGRSAGGLGSSDIWVSYRGNVHDDFGWEAPRNLGAGVNASGFEGGPSYFENGDAGAPQLYFNKNPLPSNGGGDINVSEQAADGSWGTAVAVPQLNSDSTDQRPSVAFNGLTIYFYSNRLGSMPNPAGTSTSNDLWVSTRASVLEPWSAPTNVGAPINTAAGELHPFIFSHGRIETLYFTRNVAAPPAIDQDLFVSTRVRAGGPE